MYKKIEETRHGQRGVDDVVKGKKVFGGTPGKSDKEFEEIHLKARKQLFLEDDQPEVDIQEPDEE